MRRNNRNEAGSQLLTKRDGIKINADEMQHSIGSKGGPNFQ